MPNIYGLPDEAIEKVRVRDRRCVYCRKVMRVGGAKQTGDDATIEHLNHLPPWDDPETIAICYRHTAEKEKSIQKQSQVLCCGTFGSMKGIQDERVGHSKSLQQRTCPLLAGKFSRHSLGGC